MRSLSPERHEFYVGLRKKCEDFVAKRIAAGSKSGDFAVPDIDVVTQSILSMLTSVCYWYCLGDRVSQERLIDVDVQMVLAILASDALSTKDRRKARRAGRRHAATDGNAR